MKTAKPITTKMMWRRTVEAGSRVTRTIVGRGARVGPGTALVDAVIGDHADTGSDNELIGTRLWVDTTLPDGALRVTVN